MSLYSYKQNGTGAVQPWSQAVTLAEAGKGCDGLFGLYDSLGDKTLVGANTISTLLDGPEKVVRYGALTLGDGTTPTTLTASQRCKGLTILCDSLVVKANATLHMTGKGARVMVSNDPRYPFVDFVIPLQIVFASSAISHMYARELFKKYNIAPWDKGFWDVESAMLGFNCGVLQPGASVLVANAGCGVGADYRQINNVNYYAGGIGGGGVFGAPGGGGSGGVGSVGTAGNGQSHNACNACVYGGGAGSGGCVQNTNQAFTLFPADISDKTRYSGPGKHALAYAGSAGGGAGNPGGSQSGGGSNGGDGVGGRLTIICRGVVTVQSGGKIEANGIPGGAGASVGGGGSGGGSLIMISPAPSVNAGTIQAAGGSGGAGGGAAGGAGGAGSVVTKTFSDMGW